MIRTHPKLIITDGINLYGSKIDWQLPWRLINRPASALLRASPVLQNTIQYSALG
jgi:hypothetical protein